MFWLLLLLAFSSQAQESKELRPCFERYPNHRLVNVQPFHSEWRMRSEDHCLRFCALSSSRCRSVVFDSVQHICHYFLDEGRDVAVPAAKMVYLRVVSKDCLDGKDRVAAEIEEFVPETVTQPIDQVSKPSPPVEETVTSQTTSQEVGYAGSFDSEIPENNELRRDIQAPETSERWQSSMEKVVKSDDEIMFKRPKATGDNSAEVIMESKKQLEAKLKKRLEMLQERFPDKYVELVADSAEVMTTTKTTTTTTERPTTMKPVRRIAFNEQMMTPKKLSFNYGDVRRKPTVRSELKSVDLGGSSVEAKAKMFLDSVNGEAEVTEPTVATTRAPATQDTPHTTENGCEDDKTAVWVTFENSLDRTQSSIDSSSALSKEECQQMCNSQSDCLSFSFFDKESQCQLNLNSEGVKLKASPRDDFSASTSTRFCYSKSLVPFRDCTNFIGFRDLSLQVAPREQFDGLPKGHQGMELCIELCVLTSEFICRSASFLVEEGRCLLNAEDSLTQPDLFKSTLTEDHLYFENACSSPGPFNRSVKSASSIERISLQKSSQKMQLKIKPIKPKAMLVNGNGL